MQWMECNGCSSSISGGCVQSCLVTASANPTTSTCCVPRSYGFGSSTNNNIGGAARIYGPVLLFPPRGEKNAGTATIRNRSENGSHAPIQTQKRNTNEQQIPRAGSRCCFLPFRPFVRYYHPPQNRYLPGRTTTIRTAISIYSGMATM